MKTVQNKLRYEGHGPSPVVRAVIGKALGTLGSGTSVIEVVVTLQ
jgi:hypothetical protein